MLRFSEAWRVAIASRLPYPAGMRTVVMNREMIVHGDKAYLFTGCPQVDYFDLMTDEWGYIMTTYKPTRND